MRNRELGDYMLQRKFRRSSHCHRPAPEGQQAPPDDYALYANFIRELLKHYPGQIGAIEVWNEENLEREWNGSVKSLLST